MKKVLVTGSNGFIGSAIMRRLHRDGYPVRGALRSISNAACNSGEYVTIENLAKSSNWSSALEGIEVVIHTAARAHIMHDLAADPLKEYFAVNVGGTLNLARQAVASNVKRFIFISTVKVNGKSTTPGEPGWACLCGR